ncbi:MAG: hypothetical protein KC646_07180 [Candidatus Cloacimonetes bacterium]|nr:hypothetical protein [Candidatus Cloacimonadota bacterium]
MKALLFLIITAVSVANHQNGIEMEVPVTSHTAVYENVIEQIPYEACWVEQVPVKKRAKFNLGGALVGGLLGSKVGKGSGKKAATVLGALLASGVTQKKNTGYYTKEQRCETRYKQKSKKVLTGYTHHVNILGTSYERFYTYKKDKLDIFLNIQFQDDMMASTVVSQPVKVVKVIKKEKKYKKYKRKHHRYPRSNRNLSRVSHSSRY